VSSKTGEGVEALWAAVAACTGQRPQTTAPDHDLLELAQHELTHWFATVGESHDPEVQQLFAQWRQGTLGQREAAASLLEVAGRRLRNHWPAPVPLPTPH
jgi:hypothetical protein